MPNQVIIARQAIFNTANKIVGFELLHRTLGSPHKARITSGTTATLDVIANGIDLVVGSTQKDQKLFINFPSQLLFEGKYLYLDKKKFVLELLENETIDDSFCNAVAKAKSEGYCFALDDVENPANVIKLIPFADFIKIDFNKLKNNKIIHDVTKYLKKFDSKLLAEKVESYNSVDYAKQLGYQYFQGFFFSTPQIFYGKAIAAATTTHLNMMYELNKKNYDYDRLAEIVTTDAILSFKLLKFVNSPFYGQQTQTTSIKRALLVLGYRELKQWMHINLLSRSATTDIDKELIYLSAFRSKFLSILRETQPSRCNIDLDMCLPSLFSLLDVLLKMPFDAIFEQIHCLDTIKKGLTDHNAPCRKCFTLVQCFEKNESEKIETYRKTFPDIDFDHINYEALGWANSIAR